MKICPECNGEKSFKVPSCNPLHVYSQENPIIYDIFTCEICNGVGEISDIEFAIYKARGGSAPPIHQ